METNILNVDELRVFIEGLNNKKNHRFLSWEHCIKAFKNSEDVDYLSLHLAFYLASWGMYRGSGQLLWKDYRIHNKAVEILLKNKDITADNVISTILLREALYKYYKEQEISPTDTLLSKIILGTLGITPAFDRYFNAGYLKENSKTARFDEKTLLRINTFIDNKRLEIQKCRNFILKNKELYTDMKIVDMYYWQIGFNDNV